MLQQFQAQRNAVAAAYKALAEALYAEAKACNGEPESAGVPCGYPSLAAWTAAQLDADGMPEGIVEEVAELEKQGA